MPHMDGFQFVSALRADRDLPRMPVIFLTSLGDDGRARELGPGDYLAKPVRLEELLSTVLRHLPPKTLA
jgi:CheY-like chemotaxis protein